MGLLTPPLEPKKTDCDYLLGVGEKKKIDHLRKNVINRLTHLSSSWEATTAMTEEEEGSEEEEAGDEEVADEDEEADEDEKADGEADEEVDEDEGGGEGGLG